MSKRKHHPKEAYYFSHDSNARHDPKILALRLVYDYQGYGWYFAIIEILREQHEYKYNISLPFSWNALASELNATPEKIKTFLDDCIHTFQLLNSDDKFFWSESLNRRMKEKEERTKTAKKAAKISWDNRKKNNGIKGDANAMQEQCGSNAIKGKESKVKGKNNIFPADSVEYELSNLLLLKILENNPNVKKPDLQLWSKEMDLMIRCDNRNVEDIRKAIEWCQSDNFWKGNILSVTKLRKNFDQLTAKMNNSCKKPGTMGGLSLARMQ